MDLRNDTPYVWWETAEHREHSSYLHEVIDRHRRWCDPNFAAGWWCRLWLAPCYSELPKLNCHAPTRASSGQKDKCQHSPQRTELQSMANSIGLNMDCSRIRCRSKLSAPLLPAMRRQSSQPFPTFRMPQRAPCGNENLSRFLTPASRHLITQWFRCWISQPQL